MKAQVIGQGSKDRAPSGQNWRSSRSKTELVRIGSVVWNVERMANLEATREERLCATAIVTVARLADSNELLATWPPYAKVVRVADDEWNIHLVLLKSG